MRSIQKKTIKESKITRFVSMTISLFATLSENKLKIVLEEKKKREKKRKE